MIGFRVTLSMRNKSHLVSLLDIILAFQQKSLPCDTSKLMITDDDATRTGCVVLFGMIARPSKFRMRR